MFQAVKARKGKLKIGLVMTVFLCGFYLFGDNHQKYIQKRDTQVRRVMGAGVVKIRQFNHRKLAHNQIALRINRQRLALSPKDLQKYQFLSRNVIERIDYITSRCSNDVAVLNTIMDKQRIATLYDFNEKLLEDKQVKWRKVEQVGCRFEFQAQNWFHGFVITLKTDVQTALGEFPNFDKRRLHFAELVEFKQGDETQRVRDWNKPTRPMPPKKFRQGHITKANHRTATRRRVQNGYELHFNAGPVPTPVVCEDTLYVSGGFKSRNYYAFQARNGKGKWAVTLSDNGPSTAVCARSAIVINTESCTLFVVRAENGEQIWSQWLGDPLITTPLVVKGIVYTAYPSLKYEHKFKKPGAPTHVMIALSARNGKILWQKWIDSDLIAQPVAVGTDVYAATAGGITYRFHGTSGKIKAARRLRATAPPVAVPEGLLISVRRDRDKKTGVGEALERFTLNLNPDGFRTKLRPAPYLDRRVQIVSRLAQYARKLDVAAGFYGGAPHAAHMEASYIHLGRKSVSTMQSYQGARPLAYKDRYILVQGDQVVAYDKTGGAKLWSLRLPGDLKTAGGALGTPPVLAGDSLYLGTLKGSLLRIDPNTGVVQKSTRIGSPMRARPLVFKERIYIPTTDGRLIVKNIL